jgi:SHS2 domain-containing protein
MGKTLYEIFEHTADAGLRVRAATREQLFVEAARGLLSIVIANPQQIRPLSTRTMRVDGQELDYLMFDWLNEVLYTLDAEKFLVADCQVRLDEQGLSATCRGEQLDPERHESDHEIKAITYHGLRVEETPDGWLAEVIVDI